MNTEPSKRKLSAILSADVKDYSRLMSQDERGTIRTLTAYKEAMSMLIQEYKGRVVDSTGDNLLAEFSSVVDSVNCAVEIQRELAERNADVPPARQMEFRIGINLGDVVEEEGRIYGDGVNIAARLEGLAEAGGICISGTAYDHVKNKLGLEYEYLGEQEVKNIAEPVRVYRVLSFPGAAAHRVVKAKKAVSKTWRNVVMVIVAIFIVGAAVAVWHFYFRPPPIEVASVEKMAFPLPDKPSIAVLPFENLSDDPKQEYLSDGISEAIISALSKVPRMFVIARNSSFTYKGKPVKVQQVAEELSVRYVLEGSVQRSGEKLRVTAQLIDAIKGHHLWSERYDLKMDDLLTLQDKIAMNVLVEVQVKLTDGEQARLLKKETNNLKAYEKYLEAIMYRWRTNREDNFKARQLFEEAIRLDPDFSGAYRGVAGRHLGDVSRGWSQDPGKSFQLAVEYAQKALALDENNSYNLLLWSAIHTQKGDHEKAIELCRRALEINPNDAATIGFMGGALFNAGRYEEAIPLWEKSGRLNPLPSVGYFRNLGLFYWFTRRYEEAIVASNKALQINPDDIITFRNLAAIYAVLGKEEKAHAAAAQILRLNPNFSIERHFKNMPWKDREGKERYMDALRKAGLPDGKSSLPLPDKPSIAVLPFVNMSDDPKQEYFSDGLTEEIITALSKVRNLFVIARNSTFTYKDKAVKVKQVAEELGVRYVLEGSVRKSENRLRITTQLIDAVKGHHVWAERYDRKLKDIFGVQDEITKKVIIALQVELTEGEQARIYGKGTDNFEAYEKFLRGLEYFLRFNEGDNVMARQAAAEAIAFDPEYVAAYVMLGFTHLVDVYWGKSSQNSMEQALEAAQRALSLDEYFPPVHNLLGAIYRRQQQWEKAIAEGKRAIALNPNYARGHVGLAETMLYAGRFEEAIELLKKAMRLNPYYHPRYVSNLGLSYQMAGHYEEALKTSKEYLTRCEKGEGDPLWAHIGLTEAYMKLGREEEARAHAAEVLKINPNCSLDRVRDSLRFKDPKHTERYLDALRKAGLPD